MSKPELGVKRDCPECGARFYDLTKEPAHCPKCDHEFIPEALLKPRRGRKEDEAPAAKKKRPRSRTKRLRSRTRTKRRKKRNRSGMQPLMKKTATKKRTMRICPISKLSPSKLKTMTMMTMMIRACWLTTAMTMSQRSLSPPKTTIDDEPNLAPACRRR